MADREKVIENVKEAIGIMERVDEPTCWDDYVRASLEEALTVLRAQEDAETRLVRLYSRPGVYADLWLHCEKCGGKVADGFYRPKFCPECGRKVQWNDD